MYLGALADAAADPGVMQEVRLLAAAVAVIPILRRGQPWPAVIAYFDSRGVQIDEALAVVIGVPILVHVVVTQRPAETNAVAKIEADGGVRRKDGDREDAKLIGGAVAVWHGASCVLVDADAQRTVCRKCRWRS